MIRQLTRFSCSNFRVLLTAVFVMLGLWTVPGSACVMPPVDPPTIHIERHSDTHVWLTICGFTSFGSEGNNLCLCALGFDEIGIEITEIKSVEIVPDTLLLREIWGPDVNLDKLIQGNWEDIFKFGKDQRVSDAVEAIESGDWAGFFSQVNGFIPGNIPVKIMFDICIEDGVSNDDLLKAMKSLKILTDAGTQDGKPQGHHQHVIDLESSSGVEFDDNRVSLGVGKLYARDGRPHVHPMPLTAGEVPNLSFTLEEDTDMKVELFNTLGRRVRVISSGRLQAGSHSIPILTADLAPGAYLLYIGTPDFEDDISIPVVR